MLPFTDREAVARYAEGPVRQVPGFRDLQRMTGLLLAERVPDDGHVFVLGAGGGLELKAFAEAQPGWRFCGVDPSAEMLDLAESTLGPLASRVDFQQGYIDDAPDGPFDGAACLLTLHFIPEAERRRTVAEVHKRLKPGANAESAIAAMGERLPLLSPEQDEAILREAGFSDVALFYAGFTFRGWVGYKA